MLEGLEAVRRRPGMYIGSTGARAASTTSSTRSSTTRVDEALAGVCDRHHRHHLHPDGAVTVVDNGRGIPVDMHEIGLPARRRWC